MNIYQKSLEIYNRFVNENQLSEVFIVTGFGKDHLTDCNDML